MKKIRYGLCCLIAMLTVTIPFYLLSPLAIADAEKENIPIAIYVVEIPQIMQNIAFAESHNDPTKIGFNYRYRVVVADDGTKTKEKYIWSKDLGRYQINDYYNKEKCSKLGFDINTDDGNEQCALQLYKEQGTDPWSASKYCWNEIEKCKIKRGGNYK